MNDEHASLRRVLKYVIPVSVFSVVFNLPKFFEAEIKWGLDETNTTRPYLSVSNSCQR